MLPAGLVITHVNISALSASATLSTVRVPMVVPE